MKRMTAVLVLCVPAFCGCFESGTEADREQAEATAKMMSEANRQVGMPGITRFTQKKQMKMIQEECDREDLICYAYLYVPMTGDLKFVGKCVGYGVPFSAQFTSPEYIAYGESTGRIAMPQPDPNGLYMPTSSAATWLLMIDPETNKPRPVYCEPEIFVSPFRLH